MILLSNQTNSKSTTDILKTKIAWIIVGDLANSFGFQIYELLCELIRSDLNMKNKILQFQFDFTEANEIRNITNIEYRWNLDIDIIDEMRENLQVLNIDMDQYLLRLLPSEELCEEVVNVCNSN